MSPSNKSTYFIMEPHPTVVQNTYTHAGRGGAGNLFRAPLTTPPTGVPTEANLVKISTSSSNTRFYSGRGGAGNIHKSAERPTISFDEEYAVAEAREKASPRGYVGRGGAGNFYNPTSIIPGLGKKNRQNSVVSNDSDRRDSVSSAGSSRSGFLARITSIGRNH